jgi:hypothetical protein
MGPTEYYDITSQTITEPPPVFHCWNKEFLIVGFLRCSPNLNSSLTAWRTTHLTTSRAYPVVWCPGFMVVTPPFTHPSITFRNLRFGNCSPTVGVGFVMFTSGSFCGNWVFKMNIQFCCQLCCSSFVIFRNNPSQCKTMCSCQFRFSLTVSLRWCLPMSRVCRHNLRNCRSPYTK